MASTEIGAPRVACVARALPEYYASQDELIGALGDRLRPRAPRGM